MTSTHSKKRKSNSNSAKLKHKKFYDQRPTESYAQMKYGFVPRDDLDESPQKDRNFENNIEEAKILTPELRIPRGDVPGERILSNISTNNKTKHPDRQLYIHPYKQKNRAINKIKSAEAEEKIYYVKRSEEKDSAQNLSQDSAPNLSSASTNVSSEKIRPTSNDNSGEKLERVKADLFNSGSTFLTDAIAKVREDERQRIPFFELELTLSDDVNAAISVYQDDNELVNYLENFCKNYPIPEETALHIKIFVLKQLRELEYPQFESLESYYCELLNQNFAYLMKSVRNQSEENEGLASTLNYCSPQLKEN